MNRIDEELTDAAIENNLSEVRRLLSVGANVNARDSKSNGLTPLHRACYKGYVQIVKELLEHGADIEATFCGWTPLHVAVMGRQVAVVNELLLSPNESNGTTTSILGKRKSRAGLDVGAKDWDGDTPLHYASMYGHLPVVKALVRCGANILVANNRGYLPIPLAVGRRHSAVSKYLLEQLYATTRRLPLHALLQDLTWVGDPESSGAPPLRFALYHDVLGTNDVVEILEYLVSRNPSLISSRDQDDSLPLHLACRLGASFAIVQSLVNLNKASVTSVTPRGDLPLFLACESSEPSLDTVFLLMKLYPDLVYRCEIYRTDCSWGGCSLL
jgi:ankyrin repeat protein